MGGLAGENNQNIDELNEARRLRYQAELLEQKAKVRARLVQLKEVSRDPDYNRYLEQMMKDLESGRATPQQVEREAQRSYDKYRQRMAQIEQRKRAAYVPVNPSVDRIFLEGQNLPGIQDPAAERGTSYQGNDGLKPMMESAGSTEGNAKQQKKNIEYKVGVHVFSMIGAIFVLMAFAIFGFYFLNGFVQGMGLYGGALLLVIVSRVFIRRQQEGKFYYKFWQVITGIGIGGLYAANLINYLALHTINGLVAMFITLVIAAGTLLVSRKSKSPVIRMIGLGGCYICFLPVQGIKTDLEFLMISVMLLFINIGSIFAEKRKEQSAADLFHLALNLIFTLIFMRVAWREEIAVIYRIIYVITSFTFVNILCRKKCTLGNTALFCAGCAVNGIYIFLLFLLGNFALEMGQPEMALFIHLTAKTLVISICAVIFLLWPKDNGRRWVELYYGVCTVLLLGAFSEYTLEVVISLLTVFVFTKLLAGQKEVIALDCIVVFWVGIRGFFLTDTWYCWLIAAALVLSAFKIKHMYLYHEMVITISILLICQSQFFFYLNKEYGLDRGWLYPASAGTLLVLFLLFNHLPGLKNKNQQVYNRINLVFMLLYYLGVWFCQNYILSSVMMVLGAATIVIVFRKRYSMDVSGKYLILAGFLTYFTLTGHYGSPVIVSIFLMVISLFCVGAGFRFSDKKERICGLVMAAFVCLKLVVYDFREVEAVYRMVVFFAVGVIALLISFIYVKLEKRINSVEETG